MKFRFISLPISFLILIASIFSTNVIAQRSSLNLDILPLERDNFSHQIDNRGVSATNNENFLNKKLLHLANTERSRVFGESNVNVAVVPFCWNSTGLPPNIISSIIENYLLSTNIVKVFPNSDLSSLPCNRKSIEFSYWKSNSVKYLIIGEIYDQRNKLSVEYRLFDISTQRQTSGFRYVIETHQLSQTAHKITTDAFRAIFKKDAYLPKLVSFVEKSSSSDSYSLYISDIDGSNPQIALRSRSKIFSPETTLDGTKVAFIKNSGEHQSLYFLNLQILADSSVRLDKKMPTQIAKNENRISNISWSTDGSKLTFLSKEDGYVNLILYDTKTSKTTAVTKNWNIDIDSILPYPTKDKFIFIATIDDSNDIYSFDTRTGQLERIP